MKKRWILCTVAVLCIAAALLGCGKKNVGTPEDNAVVEEDDKLRRKLIKACGINTIRVTQSKIDELVEKGINLFPVDGNLDYESQSDDSEDEEEEEFED